MVCAFSKTKQLRKTMYFGCFPRGSLVGKTESLKTGRLYLFQARIN